MKTALVIYGCGPQDSEKPTPVAAMNAAAGAKTFAELEDKVIITTGGKTGESSLSEAEVIAKRLVHLGIPQADILLEEEAMTTIENVVFVANILDRKRNRKGEIDHLIHLASREHLARIRELCKLIGIEKLSEFRGAQDVLGNGHPLIKMAGDKLQEIAANEARRMKGLREVHWYWLPQAAEVESLERWRSILCQSRLKGWLRKEFGISPVDLTESDLRKLRGVIKNTPRTRV